MDCVATNGERLDEGELLEGQLAREVKLARGQDHPFAHAAVAHHAKGPVTFAAVGMAAAAGVALLAVEVRLDSAAITWPDIRHAFADGEHFDSQFVPRNARIAEEGHFSEVPAVVGAA